MLHVPPPSLLLPCSHVHVTSDALGSPANKHPSKRERGRRLAPRRSRCQSAKTALGSSRLRTRVGRSICGSESMPSAKTLLISQKISPPFLLPYSTIFSKRVGDRACFWPETLSIVWRLTKPELGFEAGFVSARITILLSISLPPPLPPSLFWSIFSPKAQ